jgi:hypothetical protein
LHWQVRTASAPTPRARRENGEIAAVLNRFAVRSGVRLLIARSIHQFNAGGIDAAFVVQAVIALVVDAIAGRYALAGATA